MEVGVTKAWTADDDDCSNDTRDNRKRKLLERVAILEVVAVVMVPFFLLLLEVPS